MKRSRFTEEQIIAVLGEQEAGVPTAEVCRKHGVSSATFYKWKAKFGGLDVSEARRLKARRRGGRKRAMGTRRPIEVPLAANQRWSLDFIHDQLTDGRRFRILAIVDDCTRECLALVADTSISGRRVARELDSVVRRRGQPRTIVSDNGAELTSNAILSWADAT